MNEPQTAPTTQKWKGGEFPPIFFPRVRGVLRFLLLLVARFSGDFFYHGFPGFHGWKTRRSLSGPAVRSVVGLFWLRLPEFQQVTLKVLRWEERDKRLVVKDAEVVA